jgi:hypothetical protein
VEADSKNRFSNRAAYYAKFRPSYPAAILNFMKQELGLTTSEIAGIGSGTGILSQMFLKHDDSVFGVEPNKKIRGIAEVLDLEGLTGRLLHFPTPHSPTTLGTRNVG